MQLALRTDLSIANRHSPISELPAWKAFQERIIPESTYHAHLIFSSMPWMFCVIVKGIVVFLSLAPQHQRQIRTGLAAQELVETKFGKGQLI